MRPAIFESALLSYFVLMSVDEDMKLLSWFGSELAGEVPKPERADYWNNGTKRRQEDVSKETVRG